MSDPNSAVRPKAIVVWLDDLAKRNVLCTSSELVSLPLLEFILLFSVYEHRVMMYYMLLKQKAFSFAFLLPRNICKTALLYMYLKDDCCPSL